ncbi:MAG: phosphate acyltransferase, partial [Lachnospiraceae bacterium]|nr:phosphate acyltransferase [Lachnospiraceae bacterium]
MGTIYMKQVMHYEDPVVKLVNLGVEEEKGNALTKAAHPMLQQMEGIHYGGFV